MIKVAEAPLDVDLSDFSRWLFLKGHHHRITEDKGVQVILMVDDTLMSELETALQRYVNDAGFRSQLAHQISGLKTYTSTPLSPYPRALPNQAPLIFLAIFFSVLVAALSSFGQGGPVLRALLIVDPFQVGSELLSFNGRLQGMMDTFAAGQIWRLLSPVFIHFSILHITFNLLLLWVLGGQMEIKRGSVAFLFLFLFVACVSNIAQYFDSGYLFGGLSGVVYGLVGYCWVWKRFAPTIFFPEVLLKFSLAWLLIGYTPITEMLGLGRMANSAHLFGLLSGGLWGVLMHGLPTQTTKPSTDS